MHKYRLRFGEGSAPGLLFTRTGMRVDEGMLVNLASSSTDIPPPSPELLATHAALAKVKHLSAAGEKIDQIYDDFSEITTLASDGSTDISSYFLVRGLITSTA